MPQVRRPATRCPARGSHRRTSPPSRACSAPCCCPRTPSTRRPTSSRAATSTGPSTSSSSTRSSTSPTAASRPTPSPSAPSSPAGASSPASAALRTCTRWSPACPVAASVDFYAEIVREKAILRRLIEVGDRIAAFGWSEQGELSEIVDRAQKEVLDVDGASGSDDYTPLSELMDRTIQEIDYHQGRGDIAGLGVGVPRARPPHHWVPARPDDRGRGPARRRQVHPRPRLLPRGLHQAGHPVGHLLAGDDRRRDRHAPALGRGQGRHPPHARRRHDRSGVALHQHRHAARAGRADHHRRLART